MKRRVQFVLRFAFAGLAALLSLPVLARSWPSRPISMVVVFAAGGAVINDAKITTE